MLIAHFSEASSTRKPTLNDDKSFKLLSFHIRSLNSRPGKVFLNVPNTSKREGEKCVKCGDFV